MSHFRRRSPWVSALAALAALLGLHPVAPARAQAPLGVAQQPRPAPQQPRPAPQQPGVAQAPQPRVAQAPQAGVAQAPQAGNRPPAQNGAPQPRPPQPAVPQLSPEAAAALERLLTAWEARNSAVKTWSCDFYKWEYNAFGPVGPSGDRLAFAESTGEIKYAMPDKGLFRVKESKQWNA